MKAGTIRPGGDQDDLHSFFRSLFLDIERICPFAVHSSLDCEYLLSRYKREGDKFLFTVLPLLGKAVEESLILEEPLKVPPGFHLKKGTRLPVFLFLPFARVFELETGKPILSFASSDAESESQAAVLVIRQTCLMWSKVEGSFEDSAAVKAVEGFRVRTQRPVTIIGSEAVVRARELLERVFRRTDPLTSELQAFEKEPWGRHGPGAVADHSSAFQKWEFSLWPGVDSRLFDFSDTLRCKPKALQSQPYARVTVVPKDFRGPRIICVEPKENQFAQQGLMAVLYRFLHLHPLTRRSIDFDDTSASEALCFRHDVCTIDLKDASDNLSLALARLVLPRWIFKLVTRYRTRTVRFRNVQWEPNCLATMGNACCFPLETLIFWALARSTVSLEAEGWMSRTRNPVRVYGDDIIVPQWAAGYVVAVLESCGLVINRTKTCCKTLIKESCGEWVYLGKSQRIVRPKSTGVKDIRSWLQYKDYSVLVRKLGFLALSEAMRDSMRRYLKPESVKTRWNKMLQRLEFRAPGFANLATPEELDGNAGLYAWQVRNATAPFLNGTRLKVKMRWTSQDPYSFNDE